jgi:hypothetical protein
MESEEERKGDSKDRQWNISNDQKGIHIVQRAESFRLHIDEHREDCFEFAL